MKRILFVIMALFTLICVGCSNNNGATTTEVDNYKLSVLAPGGAPAIAAAELATTYKDDYTFTLGVEASVLQTEFVNKTNDVIIAPINLGANMYSKNQNYVLASVLTWGNLFFASGKANFTLADMNGADVIFFGQNTVNDVVVKYVLEQNNIVPANITYLGDTGLTRDQLVASDDVIVLIAEPALSVAKAKKANITSISVQDLYQEASGNNKFPQAGCFVKQDTIKEHKAVVDSFLERLETSAGLCATQTEVVAGYAEAFALGGTKPILTKAIPNCNINYVKASNAKAAIEFAVSIKPALFGGAVPANEFYYA